MTALSGPFRHFRLNNLVIPSIGAVTTVFVDVALAAGSGVFAGDVGIAIPTDANFTAGVCIGPVRANADNSLRLMFVNGSAGALDPADTFDFDVYMFTEPPITQTI